MLVRKLKPREIIEYYNISSVCFEWAFKKDAKSDDEYYQTLLARQGKADNPVDFYLEDCLYGAYSDDGTMTGGAAFIPYTAQFDGHQVKLSGVGGVCTLPEYRRTGGIRAIFQKALSDLYHDGTVLSYLYPFSQAYYEKFGYTLSNPALSYSISLNHIRKYEGGQISMYRGGDISAFEQAYQKMNPNLMLKRDAFQWSRLTNADPFKTNSFAFLLRDEHGEPCGYIIFNRETENGKRYLSVKEIIYDSPIALGRLITFLSAYASDCSFARLTLPRDANIELYCTDMVLSGSKRELAMNGMHRVVNVQKALELAAYRSSGQFAIKVTDEIILENNATFFVRFEKNRAVSVEKANGPADIEMDIRSFSSALIGRYDAAELKWLPNVSILNGDTLEQVFYRKPMFISDYF